MLKTLSAAVAACCIAAAAQPLASESLETAWVNAGAALRRAPGTPRPAAPTFKAGPVRGRIQPQLIRGEVVNTADYPEVIRIGGCTQTMIGPRVVVTAAHCAGTGAVIGFKVAGSDVSYKETIVASRLHTGAGQGHDVAVGIVDKPIKGAKPISVAAGNTASVGMTVTLFGYGCTIPGGGGADGKLRKGNTTVTSLSGHDMITQNDAQLCYGDSGGPSFTEVGGKRVIIGINSRTDTNSWKMSWLARLDTQTSIDFFNRIIKENNVEICGINLAC